MKLESFYNLLVEQFVDETVGTEESGTVSIFMENRKDVIEMSQRFLQKNYFYWSYFIRQIVEMVLALVLIWYFCGYGIPVTLEASYDIENTLLKAFNT